MQFRNLFPFAAAAFAAVLPALVNGPAQAATTEPRPSATYYNLPRTAGGALQPDPSIANGSAFGKLNSIYFTSGTGPASRNTAATTGTPERFIDPALTPLTNGALPAGMTITEAQAYNNLMRIKENLEAQGLSLKDVIYIRCYLDNPPGATVADYAGWNRAWRKFFANVNLQTGAPIASYDPVVFQNATRPARTTLEVASLPVAGWLIEIEAIASYAGK
jgi:enamine deaminase RidA (YjgF/YER057c/UK114 family)